MKYQLYLPLQILLSSLCCLQSVTGFTPGSKQHVGVKHYDASSSSLHEATADSSSSVSTIEDASRLLAEWDRSYNPESPGYDATKMETDGQKMAELVPPAVRLLAETASNERNQDSTQGRCMLGICASSTEEGIATLKSWVTSLELPRGLLHGMDKDGVPLELEGGVYIKYNSGGVYSFADIRKSGMGFDALWKPGDALLEPYDGVYRGVYFQVELTDGEFRQYLVPLDIFMEDE